MEDRSGTDEKFIKHLINQISKELQANNNCSKSSLFIVTDSSFTKYITFDIIAVEIAGSRFPMNFSFELQPKWNESKDVGNEFSINKLTIFSTSQFIPFIMSFLK